MRPPRTGQRQVLGAIRNLGTEQRRAYQTLGVRGMAGSFASFAAGSSGPHDEASAAKAAEMTEVVFQRANKPEVPCYAEEFRSYTAPELPCCTEFPR
jgi:hypothetical protein